MSMSDNDCNKSSSIGGIDRSFLALLRCPCPQQRSLEEQESGLSCTGCERIFPIVDGIPSIFLDEDSQT